MIVNATCAPYVLKLRPVCSYREHGAGRHCNGYCNHLGLTASQLESVRKLRLDCRAFGA
jgi:hypothetical protein